MVHARAALRAIDLSAELGRRAERLLAMAPKPRVKGADDVVARLLSDDAIVASERIAGMSDRGLRQLFDLSSISAPCASCRAALRCASTGCSRWWRACAREGECQSDDHLFDTEIRPPAACGSLAGAYKPRRGHDLCSQ
jgi:hypothetical protein